VLREIGTMVETSRQTARAQLASTVHELEELKALSGKNREVVEKLRNKVVTDKHAYDETVRHFNITRSLMVREGNTLLAHLREDRLEDILLANRTAMEGSWTTSGLTHSMQHLLRQVGHDFDKIYELARRIMALLDIAYKRFHEQHGFEKKIPPELTLEIYREKLKDLLQRTDAFCRDPVNIMTEKHFLIKKFYIGLVTQARQVFGQARHESEAWLRRALEPLMSQIREHKTMLERRADNLKKILDNIDTLQERIKALTLQQAELEKEKIISRKNYRSSAKTLIGFTECNIALNLGEDIPLDVIQISTQVLKNIKKDWKNNYRNARHAAVESFCRQVQLNSNSLSSIETKILEDLALWAHAMHITDNKKLMLMKQMVFKSTTDIYAYQHLLRKYFEK
jgi:hypothetical protein